MEPLPAPPEANSSTAPGRGVTELTLPYGPRPETMKGFISWDRSDRHGVERGEGGYAA